MIISEVKETASRLYKLFDWKEFDDKTKRVICVAEVNSPEWDEAMKVMNEVSTNTSLSMDSYYRFTMEALGQIADATAEDEDGIREAGYELEADCYTSDLTEWLGEHPNHVYYLTEVLEEFEIKDGFQALAAAQQKAMQEVFDLVLGYLLKI